MILHVNGIPAGSVFAWKHPRTGVEYTGIYKGGDFYANPNNDSLWRVQGPDRSDLRLVSKAMPLIDVRVIEPWLPPHFVERGSNIEEKLDKIIDLLTAIKKRLKKRLKRTETTGKTTRDVPAYPRPPGYPPPRRMGYVPNRPRG